MTDKEYKQAYYRANKEHIAEQQKKWMSEHEEQMKDYHRKYYTDHKEELDAYRREWYAKNKEKSRAYKREWYAKNKDKVRAREQARNAEKKAKSHGAWLDFSHMENDMDTAACSVCHRYAYELTGHNNKMTLEYCPHCGAKMEE